MNDPYRILGVNKGSSPQDIKQAFKKLAKEYHPDKPDGDEAKFKQINEAYDFSQQYTNSSSESIGFRVVRSKN